MPLNYSDHAWLGQGYFIIEADESDGSFLYYSPDISIITNVDSEHLDYYKDRESLDRSFYSFAAPGSRIYLSTGASEF